MTTLLALDPGGQPTALKSRSATGYSLWHYDAISPLTPIRHGQVKGNEDVFIDWWRDEPAHWDIDEVVCEKFVIDGRTSRPDITPKAIEGALKALWDGPIAFQANTFKTHMTDANIKRLGLWWTAEPHATDSLRHAWAAMKVRLHGPTMQVAWPIRAL